MRFPESGDFWFPGGLTTVSIDCDLDRGSYWEPNVWMHHSLNPGGASREDQASEIAREQQRQTPSSMSSADKAPQVVRAGHLLGG